MRSSSRTAVVRGRVVDERGAPIAGASIAISTEVSHRTGPVTDANGEFVATVPRAPAVRLAASHPDYGLQHTDMRFDDWSRYDAIPTAPIELTLRRGVVLRGRLVSSSGAPIPHETLLLVYDYRGSGPFPLETTTDAQGAFVFPRALLSGFELVVGSLDHWHPETRQQAGEHFRVVAERDAWLAHARVDEPVTVTVERFTLVPVTLALSDDRGAPVAGAEVDVWVRRGPEDYVGSVPRTDAHGRCTTLMEPGVAYELWVAPHRGALTAPWTDAIAPTWQGSVDAATTLPLSIP